METRTTLVQTVQGMLARCDKLEELSAGNLGDQDLRGWHFVLHGSILLHYSPYGRNAGMNGRYAFVQDSEERCKEGILKLHAIARALNHTFPRVFYGPGKENEILARAAAEVMGISADKVAEYPDQGTNDPGLIVVYDLTNFRGPAIIQLARHQPGQWLWSHAMNWMDDEIYMADIVTYFYQHNVSPWGERLQISPDGSGVAHGPAASESVEELVRQVVAAEPDYQQPEESSDLEGINVDDTAEIVAMVQGAAQIPAPNGLAVQRREGRRARTRKGGPVRSSYFL